MSPTSSPSGRAGAQMVQDPNAGVVWMYGGLASSFFGGPSKDELWQFDGVTWSQPVIAGATPGGLGLFGMAFDSVNNVSVVYGGLPNSFFPIDSDATWVWNGTAWSQTAVFPAVNPGPLERPAMCFHAGIGRTVLFGGIDVQGSWNNDTWAYDGAANTWSVLPITGSKPGARTGARMVYDSMRGVCVLTGGADPSDPNGTTYWNDTWEFNGTSWTQVATNITGSRLDAMIGYVPLVNRVVVFGGINFSTFTYFGDTWQWEAGTFGAGCVGTNGTPALSSSSSPRLGQSWTATVQNLNPSLNLAFFVFGFTTFPGVDLGFLPMPGCFLFETLDVTVPITGSGGSASWTWASVAGVLGTRIYGQALCLDPVNAFGATISNAITATIGN
ncbi:MAG: hypothetical protein JNK78_11940 [Planctomycetes bacterium]|nr:hypothetical protein [Planctomycetota bacterium]